METQQTVQPQPIQWRVVVTSAQILARLHFIYKLWRHIKIPADWSAPITEGSDWFKISGNFSSYIDQKELLYFLASSTQ